MEERAGATIDEETGEINVKDETAYISLL